MRIHTIFILFFGICFYSFSYSTNKAIENNDSSLQTVNTDYGLNDFNKATSSTSIQILKMVDSMENDIDSENLALHAQFFSKSEELFKTILSKNLLPDIDSQYTSMKHVFSTKTEDRILTKIKQNQISASYWETLYAIESKQGKMLFRPSNKTKSCSTVLAPCGHHQLSVQALNDIGCTTKQCMKDREDYQKSLVMSQKLDQLNNERMLKTGFKNLPEYQKYLIHQQGASGISRILAAANGEKDLSKRVNRNMANNSPYSYKNLRKMGSKLAAKQFMEYWKTRWDLEKTKLALVEKDHKELPQLSDYELQIALNLHF